MIVFRDSVSDIRVQHDSHPAQQLFYCLVRLFPHCFSHYFLLHCLPRPSQVCERGKKLKRIHWVANIGTALNFLEGRKVRVQRLLLMFPPSPSRLLSPSLAALPAQLLPRGYKHWMLTSRDPFPPRPRPSLDPPPLLPCPLLSQSQYFISLQRLRKRFMTFQHMLGSSLVDSVHIES